MVQPISSLADPENRIRRNPGILEKLLVPEHADLAARVLGPTDTALLRRLVSMMCRERNAHDVFDAPAPHRFDAAAWLRQGNLMAVVALHDGDLVGGLSACKLHPLGHERGDLHVTQFAVCAGQRRRDVAALLIGTLVQAARDRDLGRVLLSVDLLDFHAVAPLLPPVERKDSVQFQIPVRLRSG